MEYINAGIMEFGASYMNKKEISVIKYISSAIFFAYLSSCIFVAPVTKICSLFLEKIPEQKFLEAGVLEFYIMFLIMIRSLKKEVKIIDDFLNTRDETLKSKAIFKYNSLYRIVAKNICFLYIVFFIYTIFVNIGLKNISIKIFMIEYIIPFFIQMYYLMYFSIIYLEPILFTKISHRFYDKEEIYKRKKGLSFRIHTKLFFTILNLVVIPMILTVLITKYDVTEKFYIYIAILFPMIYLIGYSEMIYKSINRPINELIKKMKRLSEGDFNVKTTVLSDDEIGELKSYFNEMVDDLREREQLKDTFGKYVSVEIAKQLIESKNIQLGGDNIEATILFSDIRNFTPLSEKMSAREVVDFLNQYFSYITKPIMENNGIINKFIGDAVMAIFAPQFGSKDHVDDAVKTVVEMREQLAEFNKNRKVQYEINFGVGLHTGLLVAGNIGTEKRLEYTVIGDTVNIASRIESATKTFNSDILISENTYNNLSEEYKKTLSFEKCESIFLKGKEKPLTLYKIG